VTRQLQDKILQAVTVWYVGTKQSLAHIRSLFFKTHLMIHRNFRCNWLYHCIMNGEVVKFQYITCLICQKNVTLDDCFVDYFMLSEAGLYRFKC
jgi:hypothetical protein